MPITAIVYLMALLPWFDFPGVELITFSIGAVPLSSIIGVNNYRFLSNYRQGKGE